MDLRLTLNLPEDYSYLTMVRRVTRAALGSFGVAAQDVDDLELLVGELATNAVRHAHTHESYAVEILLADNQATIVVSDRGIGFSREGVAQPGTERGGSDVAGESDAADAARFGGWGLPLVEALADDVQYRPNHPQGTTVEVTKRLHVTGPGDR